MRQDGSKSLSLGAADAKKLAKSFGLAFGGFLVAWMLQEAIPELQDEGVITAATASFAAVMLNALRKWLTDTTAAVLLCVAVLSAGPADAQTVRLSPGTWTGTATVTITVDADGSMTLEVDTSQPVTVLSKSTTSAPVPPRVPPGEGPFGDLRSQVRAATDKVDDENKANTREALATLYRTTAGLPVTSAGQLSEATAIMFRALDLPDAWVEWKAAVDSAAGSPDGVDDAKRAWMIIAEVLDGN